VATEVEVEACRKIQEGITIRPLSQRDNASYNDVDYNSKLDLSIPDISSNPLQYFDIANAFVQLNPPPRADEGHVASFSKLGLSSSQDFDTAKLTPAQKKGLLRGMQTGMAMIDAYLQKGNGIYNGWTIPPTDAGVYGTNYLLRAAYAKERVGALLPSEAMYLTSYTDAKGESYNGKNQYVLHFNKEEIPQVDAFWSVILYELPSILFYNNPIDRYQMGPQVPEMKYNNDGSLDIYIQHEKPSDPKKQGNWIPAPAGAFMLTMRLYNPRPTMMYIGPGKTTVPPLHKIEPATGRK
jgi:hypothetical protein